MPAWDDDDLPTPKTSGSFAAFAELSRALAERLDDAVVIKRRKLEALDLGGAKRAEAMANELRALFVRFAAWPTAPNDVIAAERAALPIRLMALQREAETLLATLPKR